MPFEFPGDEIILSKELLAFARELPSPLNKQFLLQVYKLMIDWKFQLEDIEAGLAAQQLSEAAANQSSSHAEE